MAGPVPGTRVGYALGRPFDARTRAALLVASSAPSPTGIAKQSTRYLATGELITACTNDLSQYDTDMTAGTSSVFENASARFNYSHPRTILVRCQANNTDTLNLWRHGTGGNLELLRFSAANTIQIWTNNTLRLAMTISPGLPASRANLVIAWVSEDNPDTTGASDAVQSTLMWWNLDSGDFDAGYVAHPTKSLQSTQAVWGAGDNLGTNAFTGVITGTLYENRRMSATEIAADWVQDVAAVTSSAQAVTDLQGLPPEQGVIDGESQWQGPAHVWACDATRRMERRTLQWLRNDRLRIVPAWGASTLTATNAFIRGAPGESDDRMSIAWLMPAAVPDNCNRIWARVHVRSYVSSGAAVPVRIRLYSFSKPNGFGGGGAGGQLVKHFAGTTILRNDGDIGSYVNLGSCPIARGTVGIRRGKTYLALAIAIDPLGESGNDSNARVEIGAIHVNPYYREGGQGFPVHP